MPVPISYKVRKYRFQLIFLFVFLLLIYQFHKTSHSAVDLQTPSISGSDHQDYDPSKPAGAANHQPAPPNDDISKATSGKQVNAFVNNNIENSESSDQNSNSNNKEMDYDVDKVPSAVKKPLDPPPFRHDEPGFKDKDIPTDDYTRKDNKVAVAPKPPGSVASAKNSLKEGTVKNLPGGPGVKDGVPPPPPKSPQLSKNKPVEPEDASTINDDNISPVLSSKKETQKTVFSYEKPTKDDFLNLEIVTSGGANTRLSSIKNKVLELLPSVKLPRKERYPVDKVANLPTSSKNIPKIQAEKFYSETAKEKTARLDRLDKIKEVFLISWNQYKKFAWGKDEIKPISQEGFDPFAGWSATLVDALDTLLIMGLKDEFDEALEVVRNIDFSTTFRKDIPLFETVIRYLGGLLSAYDLVEPKQPILLEKAIQLGDNLLSAFDTPNRMPKVSFLWTQEAQKFKYRASSSSPFAEIGSMSVEFTRLAQLSGNNSYYDAIDRVTSAIYAMAPVNDIPYLFDQKVDASGCKLVPLPGTMKAEKDLGNSNDDPASDDLKKQKPLKEDKNETIKKASELKNESKDSEEENEEITSTDKQIASKMRSKAEELTKLSNSDDLDQVKPSLNTIKDSPVAKKKVSFGAKAASRNSRDPLSLFSEEDIGTLGKVRKGSDVALREAAKRVNRKGFQKRAFIGDIDEEAVKEAKRIAQSAAKEAKNDLNRVKDSVGKGLESVKSKAELAKEKAEEMADKTKNIIDDTLSSTAKKAKEIADQVPAVKVKEHSDDVSAKTDVATKKVKEIFDEDISKTIVAAKKTKEIIEDNVVTKKVSITSNANGVDKSTPTTISTKLQSSKTKTSVVAETTKDTVQKSSVTSVKETDEALSSLNAASSSASASEKSKKDQLNSDDGSSLKDAIKAEQEIINAPIVNEELSSTATQSSATADKKNKEISEKSNVAEEDIEAGFSAGKTDIKTVINQLGTGRHALFACGPQPALAKIAGKFFFIFYSI